MYLYFLIGKKSLLLFCYLLFRYIVFPDVPTPTSKNKFIWVIVRTAIISYICERKQSKRWQKRQKALKYHMR